MTTSVEEIHGRHALVETHYTDKEQLNNFLTRKPKKKKKMKQKTAVMSKTCYIFGLRSAKRWTLVSPKNLFLKEKQIAEILL